MDILFTKDGRKAVIPFGESHVPSPRALQDIEDAYPGAKIVPPLADEDYEDVPFHVGIWGGYFLKDGTE